MGILALTLIPIGIVGGVLLLGNKFTDEYQCALSEIKKNRDVENLLGEQIEFVFLLSASLAVICLAECCILLLQLSGSKGSGSFIC